MRHVLIDIFTASELAEIGREYRDNRAYVANKYQLASIRYFVQTVALPYELWKANNPRVIWVNGQPYNTADEMRHELQGGILRISTDYNDSPLMPGQINLDFRAMHDLQHCRTPDCNFNAWGEICAYTLASKLTSDEYIKDFLFSEIVGQVCYLRTYGHFPEQRVVLINRAYRLQAERAYNGD